jgi:hypothetical protein
MAKYGGNVLAFATTTAQKTAIKLFSVTKFPFEIVEVGMYGAGSVAPADIQHQASLQFLTAATAGTPTSTPTATAFSQRAPANTSTLGINYSAEPTVYLANAFPLQFSFNQRGGMRWAVPQGEGLMDTFEQTNMHAGFRVLSSAVGTVDAMIAWWET